MLKRWGSIVLSLILCISVFSGCQTSMKFDSEEEMKSYVQGVWQDGSTYYVIDNNKIYKYYDWELTMKLSELEEDTSINVEKLTFEQFYEENPLITPFKDIEYKHKSGKIVSSISKEEVFRILENGTLKYGEDILTQYSQEPNDLRDLIKEEFDAEIGEMIFNKKYPDLPSAREVQYDKYGHIFDKFIIIGYAELDDYYNWGYENCEYAYFCIQITPSAGSFSDRWYVYAERNKFADLYSSLQSGSKNVTLVAQMIFVDTGSNNMATLVDYK